MPQRSLLDVARAVVADVAPQELDDFDIVARAYADNPHAAERANLSRNEPTASGLVLAGEVLGSLVLAIGADLCKDAVVFGARAASRRTRAGWTRRRGQRMDLDSPLPPIAEDEVAALRTAAVGDAVLRGASESDASAVGAALARQWPRLM